MDAARRTLPHLQLTVPMPIKTGKVGLHLDSWGELFDTFCTGFDRTGSSLALVTVRLEHIYSCMCIR